MSRSPFVPIGEVTAWVTITIAYPPTGFGRTLMLADPEVRERALDAVGLAGDPDALELAAGIKPGALERGDDAWRWRTRWAAQFVGRGDAFGPALDAAAAIAPWNEDEAATRGRRS